MFQLVLLKNNSWLIFKYFICLVYQFNSHKNNGSKFLFLGDNLYIEQTIETLILLIIFMIFLLVSLLIFLLLYLYYFLRQDF